LKHENAGNESLSWVISHSSKLTVMVWVFDQTADATVVVVGYYEAI
jgi:hypothetical protein